MSNTVYDAAIVHCPDYDAAHVRAALTEALDAIGGLGVGHDGGWVGVHEDDLVALLAQSLARLGA